MVKALLGYGARMPKELMLYVKNLVFLDGAIARLAPDLDLHRPRSPTSPLYFAQTHGERLGRELGIDHTQVEINLDGVKASFGVDASTETPHLPRPPAAPGPHQQAHAGARPKRHPTQATDAAGADLVGLRRATMRRYASSRCGW